jgi:hypothetical protein
MEAATTLVETGANSLDEIAFYLGRLDHPFEIQSPPELIERVRELATRLAASLPPS